MKNRLLAPIAALGMVVAAVGLAAPAHAAATVADNGDGTVTVTGHAASADDVRVCATTVSASDCAGTFAGAPNGFVLYLLQTNATYGEGDSVMSAGGPVTLAAGTYMFSAPGGNSVTATIGSGGSSGGDSSSGSTSQPQTLALSINTVDGSACSQSSESGFAGSWMTLPGADDCTAPATKPEATLLGWATDANFPVEIAQRQIDNGWGAYEMFNDEGRLTAVFIPAGGATFLSGDGNLFAIWSE